MSALAQNFIPEKSNFSKVVLFGALLATLIFTVVAMAMSSMIIFSFSSTPPPRFLHVVVPIFYLVTAVLVVVWRYRSEWLGLKNSPVDLSLGSVAILMSTLAVVVFSIQVYGVVDLYTMLAPKGSAETQVNEIVSVENGFVTFEDGQQYVDLMDPFEAADAAATYIAGAPTLEQAMGMLSKPTGLVQDADNPFHFTWDAGGVTTAAGCPDNWHCVLTVIGGEVVDVVGHVNAAWNITHAEYTFIPPPLD